MADYAPPSGPPPPKVPAGWLAKWNDQYSEWFYVNIYTKVSQWEKPTEPVYAPPADSFDGAPPGPPPTYDPATGQPVSDTKTGASQLSSNNPYASMSTSSAAASPGMPVPQGQPAPPNTGPDITEDERIAREMQAEEDARGAARANRGAADGYYGQAANQGSSFNQPLPPRPEGKKGFLGKLLGKSSSSKPQYQQPYYGGQPAPYGQGPGYMPQGQYAQQHPGYGYPGQGGYGQPGPGYGYGAPAGYGHGYGGYGGYGRPPPRRSGGMGTGGAAALGVGGGLLGGMLLADAMDNDYEEGYADGADAGGDDGGGDGGGE